MKLDLSADRILFRKKRNKSIRAKLELSILATEARSGIDENNQLTNSIDILKRLIQNNKQTLYKLISCKTISKKEIQNNLNNVKGELILLNKNLKGERNYIKLKYTKTKKEIDQTLSNLKTELDILINRNFIFKNALLEKEAIIKKIKLDLKNLCKPPFPFANEDSKELHLDINESEVIYNDLLEFTQVSLMVECKSYNKYQNKHIFLMDEKNALIRERRKIINDPEKTNKFDTIIEDMEKLGEEESFLNESICSTYEDDYNNIQFPDVVDDKCIIKKTNLERRFNIPKLSLNQIIYNKKRYKPEEAEKSLSRTIINDKMYLKIKKLKGDIKKLKRKNELRESRCQKFEEKIKKMENIIKTFTLINEKSKEK